MMPKLSKASEKRLLNALEDATELINDGMHPNDAIVKVASELKVPAGHIGLMVNAVNVGRTNAQRNASDDIFEKAASVPLADTSTVLSKMYPDEVTTKSAEYRNSVISKDYNLAPTYWLERRNNFEKQSIAKNINWGTVDKKEYEKYDDATEYKRANFEIARRNHEIDDLSMKLAKCRNTAIEISGELKDYFMTPGHENIEDVKEIAEFVFGKAAQMVLKNINEKKSKPSTSRCKKANYNIDINTTPYSLIKKAIDVSKEFMQLKTKLDGALAERAKRANELYRPFVDNARSQRAVLAGQYCRFEKDAVSFGGILTGGFNALRAADLAKEISKRSPTAIPTTPEIEREDFRSIFDPHHDAELRNIQAEALLNDLLANDDIIKGYTPNEVVDAFNEAAQLNPYAVTNKPMMRDLVRKRLAGGPQALDQFVMSDALKQQQTMKDIRTLPDSHLHALTQLGVLKNVEPPNHK